MNKEFYAESPNVVGINALEKNLFVLRFTWISESIIRIQTSKEANFDKNLSLSVINNSPFDQKIVKLDDLSNPNEYIIKSSILNVIINKQSLGFTILERSSNKQIFKTKENNPFEIEKAKIIEDSGYSLRINFEFQNSERIFGLGCHLDVDSALNMRGNEVQLFQQNIKVSMPVLVSDCGYGIIWDNYSYSKFCDKDGKSYLWSELGDFIDFYFVYGPSFDNIIKGFRFLTGRVPLMPKYAFGYVQSRERYKSDLELLEIVKEYRKRCIPLDLIVQDWQYWGSVLYWGQKSFNKNFKRMKQVCEEIHRLNAHIMISIWPLLTPLTKDFKELKKKGFMYKGFLIYFYDAYNPEARSMFWEQCKKGLFDYGVDAWWADSTEPYEVIKRSDKIENEEWALQHVRRAKKYARPCFGSATRYMLPYSLVQAQVIYEHQRRDSNKRVLNLTRSGFTGQQRYSNFVWTGDVAADWDVFKAQIPAGLNFNLCGHPYWTTDTGAFHVKTIQFIAMARGKFPQGNKDLGYRELYTRWFQFSTFTTMLRSHGTQTEREIWFFGEPGTPFYDTILRFIHLRYRLLPYIYSLAWLVTSEDYTIMRALAFDFMEDKAATVINDQFMFGPSILVNPVVEPKYYIQNSCPIQDSKKSRKVYLPKGVKWYDFWTGQLYDGDQTITADAPLERIPIFVKAGSIIPLGPIKQHSGEPEDPMEIRIFPGTDAQFTIYEDDEKTYDYERGKYTLIRLHWIDTERIVKIEARKGEFPNMVYQREFRIYLVKEGYGVGIYNVERPNSIILYEGKEVIKKID